MNNLIKTQYLFVKSENRKDGETYDFTINIPNRYIECEDDEILCITLLNFNVYCSWYNVNDNNNTFTLKRVSNNQSTTITLPHGNYPFKLLYQTINSLYGSNICTFNKVSNKFVFSFSEPYTLTFNDNSYQLLGFSNTSHTGTTITSDAVINPFSNLDNICVHLQGVQPFRAYNLDNMQGTDLVVSDLLCAIPFTTAPYDMFNYVNTNSEYKMFVYDKSLQNIRFVITDFNNNHLSNLPDFTMCLKVETFLYEEEDEQLHMLKKILEYTKLNYLSKHL